MMSKEEIKELKEYLKETIQNTYAEKKAIKLNNALKYIEQLETNKKKMIEILEKYKHKEANEENAICLYSDIKEITKGENDDN